jgi:PLAT/LH2 domain-containing protein
VTRLVLTMTLAVSATSGCHGTDEDHCFLGDVDPGLIVSTVRVETVTGSSGTDSDIYLEIDLDEGSDLSLYLDNAADTFEAGADETFDVATSPFLAGNVAGLAMRKDSSLFEGGDWDLEGLTITFIDQDGGENVAYDDPDHVERMTGDETKDLRCP